MKQGKVIRIIPAEDDDGPTVETTIGTFLEVCFEFDPQPNDEFELDETAALIVCHKKLDNTQNNVRVTI